MIILRHDSKNEAINLLSFEDFQNTTSQNAL